MDSKFCDLLVQIVIDLESTQSIYHGYAYKRTIRNILVGNCSAIVAPHFSDKEYYGIFDYLSLEHTEEMMDYLTENNQLMYVITDRGKMYCTRKYYIEVYNRY